MSSHPFPEEHDTVEFTRSILPLALCHGCNNSIKIFTRMVLIIYNFPPEGHFPGARSIYFKYHLKCYQEIFDNKMMEDLL